MSFFFLVAEKLFFIVLLMGAGIFVRGKKWLSDESERDLSRLVLDFFWPALIFSSITTALQPNDILQNIWLPILSFLIHAVGFSVGIITARLTAGTVDRRRMMIFHCTMNNFFIMALPFAQMFYGDKGVALLSVANLGSMIAMWTLGVVALTGTANFRETARNILTPGLASTIAAIIVTLLRLGHLVPNAVRDALAVSGQPTLLIGLLIAGSRIHALGRNALKFDSWNLTVGILRNAALPAVFFFLALILRGTLSHEALVIFMLIAVAPASVNSITLALRYGLSPNPAAEGVLFTHLFSLLTIPPFIFLIDRFLA